MSRRKGAGKQRAFLAAYRLNASLTESAKAADIDRSQHYVWLRSDPLYARDYDAARDEAAQALEDEAVRRAHEGVLEPVFYKGKPAGAVRVYSDSLLAFLLRALRPERYRDRGTVEVTGPGGGPLEMVERLNAARKRTALAK